MTLDLGDHVGSNFIKDFPGQNAVNMDKIDNYAGTLALRTDPLGTYTPNVSADTTPPTLGTGGFAKGWYYLIFDQVFVYAEFRFGTAGIANGNGIYTMSLPFPANTLMGASNTPGRAITIGDGQIFDFSSNAGRVPLTVHLKNSTDVLFGIKMQSGSSFRELREAGSGITWAVQDGISFSAQYQRVT